MDYRWKWMRSLGMGEVRDLNAVGIIKDMF
jgi:hypothetical protein